MLCRRRILGVNTKKNTTCPHTRRAVEPVVLAAGGIPMPMTCAKRMAKWVVCKVTSYYGYVTVTCSYIEWAVLVFTQVSSHLTLRKIAIRMSKTCPFLIPKNCHFFPKKFLAIFTFLKKWQFLAIFLMEGFLTFKWQFSGGNENACSDLCQGRNGQKDHRAVCLEHHRRDYWNLLIRLFIHMQQHVINYWSLNKSTVRITSLSCFWEQELWLKGNIYLTRKSLNYVYNISNYEHFFKQRIYLRGRK